MCRTSLALVSLCTIIAASLMFAQPARPDLYDQGKCVQTCQVTYDRATYPSDFSQCVTDCTDSARMKRIEPGSSPTDKPAGGPKQQRP